MKLSLRKCTAGAVGVVTAIVLPILLGFGSLGTEVGHWYLAQRQMQGAADAAAMSAAAQSIQDQIVGNTSTAYQTVGRYYAEVNGFPNIPVANTCLISTSGDNCGAVRALDARPFNCVPTSTLTSKTYCIVVEITQDTFQWLSTQASMEPNGFGSVKAIPTPTLVARSVVTVTINSTPAVGGNSCILALANARNAVQVRGNGNINARCGILIDGGQRQNARTPNIDSSPACSDGTAAPCGGLTLWGSNAKVAIDDLTVAARTTAGPAGSSCPDPNRCLVFNTTTPLPANKIFPNIPTSDPYAGRIFTKPAGQVVTGVVPVAANPGAGYTTGTRTFTVVGGSGAATKFTANVAAGKVTTVGGIVDPGQYATLPTNPVSVTADDGKGSGAKFILTFGNCFPGAQFASVPAPVPGRAYCSIPVTKTLNFSTGIYYVEGGDAACVGVCIQTGNTTVTTDAAGVTFVMTNAAGGSTYAQLAMSGNQPSVSLIAPINNINADGTPCSSGCANTTSGMIFFQDQHAPATVSVDSGGAVTAPSGVKTSGINVLGSTLNSFAGCGNSTTCRTLSGTLYFPNQTMNISGNGSVQGTCFGLVAKYIDDAGTPTFMNGCLPGSTGGSTFNPPTGTFRLAQ